MRSRPGGPAPGPGGALLAGLLAGVASGAAFALVAVAGRADPILVGTAWNLVAFGATAFGYRLVAGATGSVLEIATLPGSSSAFRVAVPLAFLLPVALHAGLARTRPGLRLSAAGERPEALRAQGISVVAVRSRRRSSRRGGRRAAGLSSS